MPLPSSDIAWPPHQAAQSELAEWSAWYSGAPDQLERFYTSSAPGNRVVRPSQQAGGVVGAVARWWWGAPQADGEGRSKLHVPLAADIAGTSADLLFSEPPMLKGDNDSLQAALDELGGDGLQAQLHEGAEVAAAMGGAYLRIVWDEAVSEMPWLDVVHADCAVPEFRWGRLTAVTFWRRLPTDRGTGVLRLLERHERGRILHGLYLGSNDKLGRVVPLTEHPESAGLADIVDEDGGLDTGTQRLTAGYVPNMLPNRAHRGSHLGRSDYQGVTPLMDALDEAYSSWHRDIRLAKARVHVPQQWLETDGPGSYGTVNLDREMYVGLNMLDKGQGAAMLQAQQFAIRYSEHSQTCRDWTNAAVRSAGYSLSTFGEQGEVAATATEVKARERRSYLTRNKKVRYWRPVLMELLETLVEVANANMGAGIREGAIKVEFGDAVQDSQLSLAQTAQALSVAQAASTETLVRLVNPQWDDTAVQAEVARIHDAAAVDDPTDVGL